MILGQKHLKTYYVYSRRRDSVQREVFHPTYLYTLGVIQVHRRHEATPVQVVPGGEDEARGFLEGLAEQHPLYDFEYREKR